MTDEESECRACPFCGAPESCLEEGCDEHPRTGEAYFYIVCDQCYARGPEMPTSEEAENAWNVRIDGESVSFG